MTAKISRTAGGALLVILASALVTVARAQDGYGLYVGGDIGRAKFHYDSAAFAASLPGLYAPDGKLEFANHDSHDSATAWWVDAGYMRWRYVGIEAAYLHLGEISYRASGTYTPTGGQAHSATASTVFGSHGPALAFVLRVPIAESFDLTLRAGDYYGKATLVDGFAVNHYVTAQQSSSGSSLLLGLGAAYTFDGHWSARIDYLRVNKAGQAQSFDAVGTPQAVGTYSVDLASVGMSYTF